MIPDFPMPRERCPTRVVPRMHPGESTMRCDACNSCSVLHAQQIDLRLLDGDGAAVVDDDLCAPVAVEIDHVVQMLEHLDQSLNITIDTQTGEFLGRAQVSTFTAGRF